MTKNWLILGALSFGVGFGLSLSLSRDIKRAALTGAIALPATATGVAVVEHRRKRQLFDTLSRLQAQIAELEKRERRAEQSLSQLQTAIEQERLELEQQQRQLSAEYQRLQTAIPELRQQELELNQSLSAIAAQKQQLEEETQRLQAQIHRLEQQETDLNRSLDTVASQEQQARENLNFHQRQLNQLQEQIAARETQTSQLDRDLAALEQHKDRLETQIDAQEQQRTQLSQSLAAIETRKQETQDNLSTLLVELSQLQTEVSSQQQLKEQLTQELAALALQKDQLAEQLRPPQIQPTTPNKPVPVDTSETKAKEPTPSHRRSSRSSQRQITNLDFDFMNARYTKRLWEEQILPHWSHRDRPAGQRFLGSVRIKHTASDRLLDIVGQNLKQLDRVTYNSLYDEFYESEQNWLKVLTFALSEYAYYYSSERFWQGFCERLDINHSQGVENTLRQVVDEGIDLLGLVRATGGYKYVSTLWLQSGVPEQNLGHFAQLVQEIADEYGWWELAHTPAEDLSQALLSFCQEKHPQWGTLINFLKASYSEGEETEPVSGQLLQGIAIVAQELERQDVSPQALQNENQREELLGSYYLPQNFFLRNWNALIQVLTPRTGSGRSRSIVSRRSKPLLLSLDIADTGNTQLILPEQALWKPEWRDLRGTYCQIPEADWEGNLPTAGDLEVPELAIDINQAFEDWSCQLLDHNRQSLLQWHYEGIASDLPCLVFDAMTGDHLPLRLPHPTIIGIEEIICFTPKDIPPQFANGIEVLDSCIPSSIRGWRGQQIALTAPESSIVLTLPETGRSQLICWKSAADEQPVLRGLKLKGKKAVYLEAPVFWYPPLDRTLTLNVLIENITEKSIIARAIETLSPNKRWFAIALNQWITEPGSYEARFWFETQRWSYQFEVRSHYQAEGAISFNQLKIRSHSGFSEADLPIKHDAPEKFWSETIKIDGLWTLEEVILFLSNRDDKIPYQMQADASGSLTVDLSTLYELLPESNWYALDYQRSGLEPQRLLEMDSSLQEVSWMWDSQGITLSGLRSGNLYELSCWNFLLPDTKPIQINISLVTEKTEANTIPLDLPTGIYYIQLLSSQQLPQNLGWWCGSSQYDLPEDTNDNEVLENYCYTVLGNESTQDFITAVKKLNPDFELQQIQAGIASLEERSYYFPEWLKPDALVSKLKGLLKVLELPPARPPEPPISLPVQPTEPSVSPPVSGKWYLVNVRSKKRDLFLKYLNIVIKQNKLQDLIVAIKTPQDSVYEDIVLLNLTNFKAARTHIQTIESCQRIVPKPLTPPEVSRMLGASDGF